MVPVLRREVPVRAEVMLVEYAANAVVVVLHLAYLHAVQSWTTIRDDSPVTKS